MGKLECCSQTLEAKGVSYFLNSCLRLLSIAHLQKFYLGKSLSHLWKQEDQGYIEENTFIMLAEKCECKPTSVPA